MLNIVRLSPDQNRAMQNALAWCVENNRSFRICTGSDKNGTWVKWDAGNTGWTPPLYSD